MENKIVKRRLDEQAKVFTLVSNPKYCSVFRFTVVLKCNVDKSILQEAYSGALEKYKALKVKLKCGLFEYYLEENKKDVVVFELEKEPTIKKINNKENNNYLIKVMFCKNEIYFDFYHALTDGTTAIRFIKNVISRYLEIKYSSVLELKYLNDNTSIVKYEDPYNLSKKYKKVNYKFSEGIRVSGTSTKNDEVIMEHFCIDVNELKELSKNKELTITMFMTSLIAYTFYRLLYKNSDKKRPINLCIPISLNKYFDVETLSNFFSHMFVSLDLKEKDDYTFEEILVLVKEQFEDKIKLEKIMGVVNSNSTKMNNIVLKCIPLCIKKVIFVLGSLKMKKQFSMTVSNVGKIEFDKQYEDYIENAYVTLSCDWAERVKCGMSSYKDRFVITFCRNIVEEDFINEFKNILDENKLKYVMLNNKEE